MFSPRPAPRATVTQLPVTLVHASRRNQGVHAPRKQATRHGGGAKKVALQAWCAPSSGIFGDESACKAGDRRRVSKTPGPPGVRRKSWARWDLGFRENRQSGDRGMQRPSESIPKASGENQRAVSTSTAASSPAISQSENGPRSACTISCMSVQRSSILLSLMSSRIILRFHRHIPRADITTRFTDHLTGPHGS